MRVGVVFSSPRTAKALGEQREEWARYASNGVEIIAAAADDDGRLPVSHRRPVLDAESAEAAAPLVAKAARKLGEIADVVIISCFLDPGLEEARAVTRVPVIGAGEATLTLVAQAGSRFTIMTPASAEYVWQGVDRLGLRTKVTSIHQLDLDLCSRLRTDDRGNALSAIVDEMRDAITVDSAEAVCAACCGFPGIEQEIKDLLGVPMFMPHQISLAVAEQIADAGRNYEVSALLV